MPNTLDVDKDLKISELLTSHMYDGYVKPVFVFGLVAINTEPLELHISISV
jgi:hypothetical protein